MSEGIRSTVRATSSRSFLNPRANRVALFSLLIAMCLLALYAHVRIAQAGDDYTGVLAPLDRVFDIAFALLLVGISFCVGRRISRILGLEFASLAEEISFSAMLGVGTIATLILGLALMSALKPWPISGLFVLLVAISHREVYTLYRILGEGFRAVMQTRTRRMLSVMFIILAGILVLRTAAPPHSFDEAIYHLAVPKLFVERGAVYPVIDYWVGDMPFLLHMIYAVCLVAKSDIAAKMFSLCLAGATSLALYGFCARFLDRRVGTVAMFGFFGAGMVVEVAVTSRIDASMSGILFLAAYAMIVFLETRKSPWLWTSAALAGFGLGVKYTAVGWLALLVAMFVFESVFRRQTSVRVITQHLTAFLFIAATIASPWYIKNFVWFHNPIYPFFTGEVAEFNPLRYFDDEDERKLAIHFDEARTAWPEVVDELNEELSYVTAHRTVRHPFRFWQYFTAPENFNIAEPYHDPNYLFLLSPFFLLFTRRRWMVWHLILAAGFFFFLAAGSSSGSLPLVGRYLLPIYPGLTILAAYSINEISVRLRSRSNLVTALPAIAIAIATGASLIVCASRIRTTNGVSFLRGATSRRQFMYAMFYYPPIDFINHNLGQNARVMMLGAQMCYDMKRDYILDPSPESTVWRRLLVSNSTLDHVNEDLKRQGVTHILYAPSHFLFSASVLTGQLQHGGESADQARPDYMMQLRNWATFEQYRRSFLEPVFADERGYHLYAIK